MKNFALMGAAGYIAPRHMRAIKETGNNLVASLDLNDSVGIIDSYFPEAKFFTEPERFDRHLDKLRRNGNNKFDYVSICSPNYLHDAHIRLALRNRAHAICEKPLVLNPWNIDALNQIEEETGKNTYTILQLRQHKAIKELKEKVSKSPKDKIFDIDLTYITSRGQWYFISWKGDKTKSGGVATNIGVHFFDMLGWIFGEVKNNIVHYMDDNTNAGYLEFEKARVRWFLSLDYNRIPNHIKEKGQRTYRSITVENKEIEFSDGFSDLHTISYNEILKGKGFRLSEARKSIEIVHHIRNINEVSTEGDFHPMIGR